MSINKRDTRDPCIKHFLTYDSGDPGSYNKSKGFGLGNSCWIDSLFVALFHTYKESIRDFINDLEKKEYVDVDIKRQKYIKDYELAKIEQSSEESFAQYAQKIQQFKKYGIETTIDISDYDRRKLEKLEKEIIEYIKFIYIIINLDSNEKEKMFVGYNLRIKLETHRRILIKYNIIEDDGTYNDFQEMNNPFQLLKYLQKHILNNKCFDNFKLLTILPERYKDLNHFLTNSLEYNNINLINILYRSKEHRNESFFNNAKHLNIKEKIRKVIFGEIDELLFLHSIIVLIGAHYTCYYKCKNNWYLYNDMLPIPKRTKLIGNFSQVKEHYNKKFLFFAGRDAEIMFLYLKTTDEHGDQPLTKRQNIIDEIYRRISSRYEDEDQDDQLQRLAIKIDSDERKLQVEGVEQKATAIHEEELKRLQESQGPQQVYQLRSQELQLQPGSRQQAAARDHEQPAKSKQTNIIRGEQIDIVKQIARYEEIARGRQQAATRLHEQTEHKLELDSDEQIDIAEQLAILKEIARNRQQAATRLHERPAKTEKEKREEEERKRQEESDHKYALSLNLRGGIQIINDRCNATIKNINDSNCNQKLHKIQKIQNGRDELIEDMNKFFNKKFLIDKK